VFADQRDEPDPAVRRSLDAACAFRQHDQLVGPVAGPERHHHPSTVGQLVDQRARDRRRHGRHVDPIERRVTRQAHGPVADHYRHRPVSGPVERRTCRGGEVGEPLDGEHVLWPDDLGDDGRVVAAARPDLEYGLPRSEAEQLGHLCHEVRGGDDLLAPDVERPVLVGVLARRLRDELVAGDGPHGPRDALCGEPTRRCELVDESVAGAFGAFRLHAHDGQCRRPASGRP